MAGVTVFFIGCYRQSIWIKLLIKQIVHGFNEYFVNSAPHLAQKITANTNWSFKYHLKGNYMDLVLLSPDCQQDGNQEGIRNNDCDR